jgi:toxin ParE1/3/4
MRRRVRRHPEVANDIIDAAAYIADDNMPASLRYLDSVEDTLHRLLDRPALGRLRDFDAPELAAVRSISVKGFRNHLIFYEIESGGIYVLAVIHGARDLPKVLNRRMT